MGMGSSTVTPNWQAALDTMPRKVEERTLAATW